MENKIDEKRINVSRVEDIKSKIKRLK